MSDVAPLAATPGRAAVRRLLPRAQRAASIRRAAATAFAAAGYSATSMEDVASQAGVSKVLVYRHFEGKEQLYRQVLERVASRLSEEFDAGMAAAEDGVAARTHVTVAREDPDAYRLLWQHAEREESFASYAREIRAAVVDVADELVGDQLVPRHDSWALRVLVDLLVDSVLVWLDEGGPDRDDEAVERISRVLGAVADACSTDAG